MKFKITGKVHPIHRVETGLYSFDHAFSNASGKIGFPMRGIVEIAGNTGCGKTTFMLSLAGILGKIEKKDIAFADIERYDPDMMESVLDSVHFENSIALIEETSDEDALDQLIKKLNSGYAIGMFDSIGAISPIAEIQGELGEANMGRRAFLLAQFSRKLLHSYEIEEDFSTVVFMTNHLYPKIGGRGSDSPGGEVLKFIAPIKIRVKRAYYQNKEELFPDGSYVLEGKVEKNRFGYENQLFHVVVLGGAGIHYGLTAMYDCIDLKLAKRAKGNKVSMNDVEYGNFRTIFAKARDENQDFFVPFQKALEGVKNATTGDDTDTDVPVELEDTGSDD